jgi:hypothetical protein
MSSFRVTVITDGGTKQIKTFETFPETLKWLAMHASSIFSKIEITKFGR